MYFLLNKQIFRRTVKQPIVEVLQHKLPTRSGSTSQQCARNPRPSVYFAFIGGHLRVVDRGGYGLAHVLTAHPTSRRSRQTFGTDSNCNDITIACDVDVMMNHQCAKAD